jgi:hypothetical protein
LIVHCLSKIEKNALMRQQTEGTPTNTLAIQGFKGHIIHSSLTTRSRIHLKNIGRRNPPRNIDLRVLHHLIRVLELPDLK